MQNPRTLIRNLWKKPTAILTTFQKLQGLTSLVAWSPWPSLGSEANKNGDEKDSLGEHGLVRSSSLASVESASSIPAPHAFSEPSLELACMPSSSQAPPQCLTLAVSKGSIADEDFPDAQPNDDLYLPAGLPVLSQESKECWEWSCLLTNV